MHTIIFPSLPLAYKQWGKAIIPAAIDMLFTYPISFKEEVYAINITGIGSGYNRFSINELNISTVRLDDADNRDSIVKVLLIGV